MFVAILEGRSWRRPLAGEMRGGLYFDRRKNCAVLREDVVLGIGKNVLTGRGALWLPRRMADRVVLEENQLMR